MYINNKVGSREDINFKQCQRGKERRSTGGIARGGVAISRSGKVVVLQCCSGRVVKASDPRSYTLEVRGFESRLQRSFYPRIILDIKNLDGNNKNKRFLPLTTVVLPGQK